MPETKPRGGAAASAQSPFDVLTRSKLVCRWLAAFRQATGVPLKILPPDSTDANHNLGARNHSKGRKPLGKMTHKTVPMMIHGRHAATLLAGPIFNPPARGDFALNRQRKERKFTSRPRVPVVQPGQFEAAASLLVLLKDHLAERVERWMMANHKGEPDAVTRAREYVEAHFADPIALHDVTQHVHLSPQYFCKLFKKTTGMTFTEYLACVRIEKAKSRLLDFSIPVKEAAYAVGFKTIAHFNHTFRKRTGFNPTRYRAKIRQANSISSI